MCLVSHFPASAAVPYVPQTPLAVDGSILGFPVFPIKACCCGSNSYPIFALCPTQVSCFVYSASTGRCPTLGSSISCISTSPMWTPLSPCFVVVFSFLSLNSSLLRNSINYPLSSPQNVIRVPFLRSPAPSAASPPSASTSISLRHQNVCSHRRHPPVLAYMPVCSLTLCSACSCAYLIDTL